MIEKDQWPIKLKKRKNHLEGGILYAPADLIWDTFNYIEKQRQEIVAARGDKAGDAIFLSQRGTPIATSFSWPLRSTRQTSIGSGAR
ncbi:hypothetical protein ACDY96_19655 [Rhizobium mongolense]|uniref:hypothetical protein n=1 Tax=Rhizobium mongolense TaxID=57676 RepID=UPI0035589C1B